MDWKALLRNKKLLWGVAAAGGLGLVVFLRKGGSLGGGADTGGADVAGGGSVVNPATVNTSGTDLAAALSNFSSDLNGQLTEFGGTITDALKNIPTGDGTPAVPPKPGIPPTNPALKPGVGWVFVKPGQTVASVAKQYGTTEDAIRSFNSANALNRFSPGAALRIRGRAGPAPK